jgi:hypothetical protein
VRGWVDAPHALCGVYADAQRRVHRCGDRHQLRRSRLLRWKGIDRQVDSFRLQAPFMEHRQRPGQAERLMTQFVAGKEEDHRSFLNRALAAS